MAPDRDEITATLARLKPDDLYPAWKWIDLMEQHGRMDPAEAQRWKDGIFGLMERWGLGPEDVMNLEG
jgi:hypothetical protein